MAAERIIAGLSCSEVLARLGDFLDDALAPDALAAVRAHVSACAECGRFGGAYASVVRALRTTAAEAGGIDEATVAAIVGRASSRSEG